nr:5-carboxymethyl-2-hydroxymuconate Delta-isomerase [Gammaproteobacteria bacterium]
MPHLILECSRMIGNKIDFNSLFKKLHELLSEQLPTKISSCKSRKVIYEQVYIGDDFLMNEFMHLTVKILPGRTDDKKQQIGQEILTILSGSMKPYNPEKIQLSVEILDLSPSYFKQLSGG